ncbi:MAG: class I SAM-dependent methyltransferase [Deltaproteobacteria bacterium]|nr:class I SAM-dependent methyltransferase [Deltaproteobacteria bacterium]
MGNTAETTVSGLLALPVKGFMDDGEAERLYETALLAAEIGPCLEIGSYCGKSTLFLGTACRENGAVLFSIDHHRGNEEQQPGEAYHDPELVCPVTGLMDTFRFFRKTLSLADLDDTVIPLVCKSALAAKSWTTPLGLVFIDGGHTFSAATTDYVNWSGFVKAGGYLVIHDIFFDPDEGGQAPRHVYELAKASGLWDELPMTKTLGILRRKGGVQAG